MSGPMFNVKTNIDAFQRRISALAHKQLPFATAQALTTLAQQVAKAEQANEAKVLDRPRPFTTGALMVVRAKKDTQEARVVVKDITARYLEPYEFGGRNRLNGRALLKPIEAVKDLDEYGNLPRNYLRRLIGQVKKGKHDGTGRGDLFVGTVQTKAGPVNGVWQRAVDAGTKAVSMGRVGKDGKFRMGKTRKGLNTTGHLVLLVKFADAHPIRQRLGWFNLADHTISRNFRQAMGQALARAIASAK